MNHLMLSSLALLWTAALTTAQTCDPVWTPGFTRPGSADDILALATFDLDGPGPQGPSLLMGGDTRVINGVECNGVAAWDGLRTRALDTGLGERFGSTNKFIILPANALGDGAPQTLFALGKYDTTSSRDNVLLRWETGPQRWTPLVDTRPITWNPGAASDMTPHDFDGSGPAPPALVLVTNGGGTSLGTTVRWTGADWAAVGTNNNINVGSAGRIASIDHDDSGPLPAILYLIGSSSRYRLEGTTWVQISGLSGSVSCSVAYDFDGDGPAPTELVVAGHDLRVGSTFCTAARFDGSQWHVLGARQSLAISGARSFLVVYPNPAQPSDTQLYVTSPESGGTKLLKWSGSQWTTVGSGVTTFDETSIGSLTVFDPDGAGPVLAAIFAAGSFQIRDDRAAADIAILDRGKFFPFFRGGSVPDGPIEATCSANPDNTHERLYVAAGFDAGNGLGKGDLGEWDGVSWTNIWPTTQPSGTARGRIYSLAVFDDDASGPRSSALYAAGFFVSIAGVSASGIARLGPDGWTPVGQGVGGVTSPPNGFASIRAMTVADLDGSGPLLEELIVVGSFTHAGGIPANRAAAWNGSSWRALGAFPVREATALIAFDADDDGPLTPSLYCLFNGSGDLGRFDGTTWTVQTAVFTGNQNRADALTVFDADGTGPGHSMLYAGGGFVQAATIAAPAVAAFDGTQWRNPGLGFSNTNWISQIRTLDIDGAGPGSVELALVGAMPEGQTLATWNGNTLRSLDTNTSSSGTGGFSAMAVIQPTPTDPPEFYLAGGFELVSQVDPALSTASAGFARLGCPPCMTFLRQPMGTFTRLGGALNLSVAVEGLYLPPYTFQWRRDGVPLTNGGALSGADTDTLTISAAEWSDAGVYDVVVGTFCGQTPSGRALVTVSCAADTNHDNQITLQDLFDYLTQFLTPDPRADANGDFAVTLDDLFTYIEAFILGCR